MLAQLSENDELVLGPWGGTFAGAVVGGVLTVLVAPQAGLEISWSPQWLPWLISAVLGGLYGACQLRVPIRALLAVGVFYGIFLWVLTNLVGWFLFPQTSAQLRSWPGFGMFVTYSLSLGFISVLVTIMGGGKSAEEARH